MLHKGYVYSLARRRNETFYGGWHPTDFAKRVEERRQKLVDGVTEQYGMTILVSYERGEDRRDAVIRERQVTAWKRRWKTA